MNVFVSYAHEDKVFKEECIKQLNLLRDRKIITDYWTDRELIAGEIFPEEIENQIQKSQIIILLLSTDFLNSEFIKNVELPLILQGHESRTAHVIPLVIRECAWQTFLPKNMLALIFEDYNNPVKKDANWTKVYREIEKRCLHFNCKDVQSSLSNSDLPSADKFLDKINYLNGPVIGRESKVIQIINELAKHKSVILTGQPGMGKSTLAINALQKGIKDKSLYFDYYQYVDYSPSVLLNTIIKDMLRSLQGFVPETADINFLFNRAMELLHDKRLLLFFDNADDLSSLKSIREIRHHLSNATFIVTSQYADRSILSPIQHIEICGLDQESGFALFTTCYEKDLDEKQKRLVVEYIDKVQGNPLFIEMAAKDGHDNGFTGIEPILKQPSIKVRHEIFNRFMQRYEQLSDLQQRILLLAGMLEKPLISIPLARFVVPCELADLEKLLDQGLLKITPSNSHFQLLSAYNYCCKKLVEKETTESSHQRAERTAFDQSSPAVKNQTKDHPCHKIVSSLMEYYAKSLKADITIIDDEWPNITELLKKFSKDSDDVIKFIDQAIGDHLDDPNGYIPKRQNISVFIQNEWQETILSRARTLKGEIVARMEKNFGIFNYLQGRYPKARELCLSAKQRYILANNRIGEIICNYLLGQFAEDQNDYHAAEKFYKKGIDLAVTYTADALLLGLGYYHLGCVYYHLGQYKEAEQQFNRAEIDEDVDQDLYARIQRRIGSVLISLGRYQQAADCFNDLERLLTQLRRRRDTARISQKQALLFLCLNELEKAKKKIDDALTIYCDELDDKRRIGSTHLLLSQWHSRNEQFDEAVAECKKSLDFAQNTKSYLGIARAYEAWANLIESKANLNDEALEKRRCAYCYYSAIHHERVIKQKMREYCKKGPKIPQPVQGVIFDLIDTLASFSHVKYEDNHQKYADRLKVDPDRFHEAWNNSRQDAQKGKLRTTRERMVWVTNALGIQTTEEILSWLVKTEEAMWIENVKFLPDAKNVIKKLKSRGVKVAILVNGPAALSGLQRSLGLHALQVKFSLSCTNGSLKPEENSYLTTLDALGVQSPPRNCVFVGDGTDQELNGARKCGLYAIRMKHTRPPYTTLENESTDWDWEVDSLQELQELLLN